MGQASALFLAILAGIALPLQAGANAELGRQLGNPLTAALVSSLVGIAAMFAVMIAFRAPVPDVAALAKAPWWSWIGGLMGVGFLILAIIASPKLGAATFIALAIAGQMTVSVLVDHYALVGFAERPVSISRILGIALIVGGVLMVQFSTQVADS